MSAIFGETLTYGQDQGPDVKLVAFGDEHYHRLETQSGFSAVFDRDICRYCYARVMAGAFVSTGVTVDRVAPADVRRHLREAREVRKRTAEVRRKSRLPAPTVEATTTMRTFGPNRGLLEGRRLSVGEVTGLTILVNFQDIKSTVTRADVEDLLNAPNYTRNGNVSSARDYFLKVSSGKLKYTNRVVGPFTLSRNRSHYIQNLLVREAMELAVASGIDLGAFDSRREKIIDAVNVLYAGRTQYLGELWPHNSVASHTFNGYRSSLYLLTSLGDTAADLSIGTFCHENGHLLCRFPDMYDYGNRDEDGIDSAGIGSYCLMGSGNHLDHGRTPAPVCGYLRELAGWADAIVLNSGGSFEVAHGQYDKIHKFETDKPNEYFIVENRSKMGLDAHLPSSGLAVYHCDVMGSNELQEGSATRHYQCALVQSDGRLDLEKNINQGDGGDLFGAAAGTVLTHASKPSSRLWDGSDSGLVLSAVGTPGPRIKFTVGPVAVGTGLRGEAVPALSIPDNSPAGVESAITITQPGNVAGVNVNVDITHSYIGDLVVQLVSPSGKVATLHDRTGSGADNIIKTFSFNATPALAALAGEPIQGRWLLKVSDTAGQDVGKLNRWSLDLIVAAASQTLKGEAKKDMKIPDNDPVGIGSSIKLQHAGTARRLKVAVEIAHPYVGDLRVELVSPSGTRVVLHNRLGGADDDLRASFDSASPGSPLQPLVGRAIEGAWILRVADLVARDKGTLKGWSLEIEV